MTNWQAPVPPTIRPISFASAAVIFCPTGACKDLGGGAAGAKPQSSERGQTINRGQGRPLPLFANGLLNSHDSF